MSTHQALTLPTGPRAVKVARDWVASTLGTLDRLDLVDSAQLGISELVTNALMHSNPPVEVRVGGTRAHPRVEVEDGSVVPPQIKDLGDPWADLLGPDGIEGLGGDIGDLDDIDLLPTFGRGLSMVAMHAAAWGSDLDEAAQSKTVWFEPVAEPTEELIVSGDVFDLDAVVAERATGIAAHGDRVTVVLAGLPVVLFAGAMRHYLDLSRELRLLSLTRAEDYPVATEFSEAALDVEVLSRITGNLGRLLQAERAGEEVMDFVTDLPRAVGGVYARLRDALDQVDRFYDERTLLSRPLTAREREVQRWWLDQVIGQAAGARPVPWAGGHQDGRTQSAS